MSTVEGPPIRLILTVAHVPRKDLILIAAIPKKGSQPLCGNIQALNPKPDTPEA